MPLLDTLINGNYPAASTAGGNTLGGLLAALGARPASVSSLIDQLGRSDSRNPYTDAAPSAQLGAPTIVQIGPDEAARAQAQQGGAVVGVGPNPMQQPAPLNAAAASQVAQSANPPVADALLERRLAGAPMQLPSVTVPDMPVTPVMADDGSTTQNATPAPSTPASGGLLGMLSGAAQDAVQSPEKSKGLLERLGAGISNMSPAASQALIASGLTMLAGNDGSRNLGQLIGLGGIAGLNAYSNVKQTDVANQLATRKLDQQQQQQGFENALAVRKQLWDEGKPISVGAEQSLYSRNPDGSYKPVVQAQPSVARTADVIGPDGRTYTVQLDRFGNQVGTPMLKTDPFGGPLSESQQKYVNDAQNAALTAQQTYQKTNALLNQLANAPEFSAGLGATFNDWLAKATGNPYEGQQLRNQLKQFVNSTILNELPPGSASDKDVQLVRNGTPSDTADKKTWKAYLSAVANVQQAAAVAAQIRADYLTANRGSLGPLMQPATIRGRQFPAGASLDKVLNGDTQNSASPSRSALIAAAQAELARRRGGR
ncbi:hypothetical protein DN523_10175 [Burkholderia multivorans]|uniref:hypothetical protein n=1 Tax=Burkholderia multivorans TaxID=87883 RepID=UPI000DAD4741|nr:hypothetical protein [Burkholderia multivorans]RAA25199.1 hypothetical protein DN471_17325 [Burkholderia multivorans]RAA27536.1 hypothetical protein DN470_10585 [Burkholderia multivorans]RAA36579.1 hypothetical protein DN465_07780 [Burkholderia multivorans]RAA42603.1 hypothetical protein DN472_17345 [Burkholderia multivorans]RAA46809.1 hypothetical protein DN500_09470 [Burkholderia multivorans]